MGLSGGFVYARGQWSNWLASGGGQARGEACGLKRMGGVAAFLDAVTMSAQYSQGFVLWFRGSTGQE